MIRCAICLLGDFRRIFGLIIWSSKEGNAPKARPKEIYNCEKPFLYKTALTIGFLNSKLIAIKAVISNIALKLIISPANKPFVLKKSFELNPLKKSVAKRIITKSCIQNFGFASRLKL